MDLFAISPIPLIGVTGAYEKPRMTYLSNFGEDLSFIIYVWLIRNKNRMILVDAGATVDMAIERGRSAHSVYHIQTMEEGLRKFNISPKDIDTIIITHLHWDHVGLAHCFPNANFIVQKKELHSGLNPHPAIPKHFYDKNLFENLNLKIIDGDTRITDGISVISTPGHTDGGQSIVVEAQNGTVVLTGFCCIKENFPSQFGPPKMGLAHTGNYVIPGIHIDIKALYESMDKVSRIACQIVPLHDPSFLFFDVVHQN